MSMTRIDARGKFFTHKIHKQELSVVIQTLEGQIRGRLCVDPEHRLKDELNSGTEKFLAVLDAEVYDGAERLVHRCEFLTVNRDKIVWLTPMDERVEENAG